MSLRCRKHYNQQGPAPLDGSSHRLWLVLASGWSLQFPFLDAGHMSQTHGSAEGERQMTVHFWAALLIPHLNVILKIGNDNSTESKARLQDEFCSASPVHDSPHSSSSVLYSCKFSSSTYIPCPSRWQHLLGFSLFFSQDTNDVARTGEQVWQFSWSFWKTKCEKSQQGLSKPV